jgi:serine protease Do
MYDNDLDNNNTSSGVTGSESQNSQESTEYRYTSGSMPYNDNSYNSSYNNNTWTSNNGGYYSNTNYSNTTGNTNYNKKKNKTDKKGIGKRIAAIALSAVLFGVIAGGTMYGVNYAANKIKPVNNNSNVEIPIVSSSVSSTSGTVNDESSAYDVKMDVAAVANAAMPAMVALQGTTTVSGNSSSIFGYGQSYEATTSGTGIIVGKSDTELLLLTNAHVIDGVSNLKCTFVDGESVNCTVKGSKSDKDIAVVAVNLSDIKSSTINQISIAELGDSDDVTLGQEVVAIGNALGEGQSVTNGIISAMNRSITVNNVTFDGLFMTNAAINSGNSGGALLNADGRVIGINFAKTWC